MDKEEIYHNHPPINKIVKGCIYCEKYGNIFNKNTLPFNELNNNVKNELYKIYALKDNYSSNMNE